MHSRDSTLRASVSARSAKAWLSISEMSNETKEILTTSSLSRTSTSSRDRREYPRHESTAEFADGDISYNEIYCTGNHNNSTSPFDYSRRYYHVFSRIEMTSNSKALRVVRSANRCPAEPLSRPCSCHQEKLRESQALGIWRNT